MIRSDTDGIHEQTDAQVLALLPQRADDLERLRVLRGKPAPTVTVVGKYNHGKSRLLNELLGRDAFRVADRRETVILADAEQDGVRWLDAPGLDADVASEDDRHAQRAAWLESDIRLFVHAATVGELDAAERTLLERLRADGERTGRQALFVLSQVDQLPGDEALHKVGDAIGLQAPGIELLAVSATRHRQGVEGGKKLLLEKSGFPQLQARLQEALAQVPAARAHECALLYAEIRDELEQLCTARESDLLALREKQQAQHQAFTHGLTEVLEKVAEELREVVDADVPDYAIMRETAADKYVMTAQKIERARIQIAYSKACIQIDAHLKAFGVTSVPNEQQSLSATMNSPIIAVLGISVKFRKDLRALFFEAASRERLHAGFSHYFELSADRAALASAIAAAETALASVAQAQASWQQVEPGP
ncbi:MAG: 50S ribosome-binding GTPase [Pseudoxanthomonas sp.]